jgi:antitoxin ParD1/3/4
MPTLNVSLTAPLSRFVQEKVSEGAYGSASEVVRDALRLLRRQEALTAAKLERLRAEVSIGLDQANAGEFSAATLDSITEEELAEPEA